MKVPSWCLRRVAILSVVALAASCTRPVATRDPNVSESERAPEVVTPAPQTEGFRGALLSLMDTQARVLECRGVAKVDGRVLVERVADGRRFLLESAQLSPESLAILARYAETGAEELRAFADERDWDEARRLVKVEMISATWCGWCTKAREWFAQQRIPCQSFDHESMGGKARQRDWGSTGLPTVKIGEQVIRGYNEELYRQTLLSEYRRMRAASGS